jgi:Tat protein translocase TatB subunit
MSFGNFGFSEILIIAVMVLIFFGPRRMPEIGRAVGGALREFRRGLNEIQRELQEAERAAKIDPDVPNSTVGSTARKGTTASKPSTPHSPISGLPTPLAAAMASPSEPRGEAQAEAGPQTATDVEAVDKEAPSAESDTTSETAGSEKEAGSERADRAD